MKKNELKEEKYVIYLLFIFIIYILYYNKSYTKHGTVQIIFFAGDIYFLERNHFVLY